MEYILCSIFLIMSSSISSLIILMNMKKINIKEVPKWNLFSL